LIIDLRLGLRPYGSDHLGLNCPISIHGNPVTLLKFQMAPDLYSWCPLAPKRRNPNAHVWVKPKLHIHKECGPRFHSLLHIYTMDCLTAPLDEDVSSGYYAQ